MKIAPNLSEKMPRVRRALQVQVARVYFGTQLIVPLYLIVVIRIVCSEEKGTRESYRKQEDDVYMYILILMRISSILYLVLGIGMNTEL